jgi:hypothetical protein
LVPRQLIKYTPMTALFFFGGPIAMIYVQCTMCNVRITCRICMAVV